MRQKNNPVTIQVTRTLNFLINKKTRLNEYGGNSLNLLNEKRKYGGKFSHLFQKNVSSVVAKKIQKKS